MAAKGLPKIRAGMGDVDAPVVEAWSDDDYRRATSLGTILSPDGKADRAGVPALEPAALRECYRTMLRIRALGDRAGARAEGELADGRDEAAPGTHGAEAAIVGAVAAVQADDIVVPGRREAVAALWRGHSVAALAAGAAIPRALGVLPGSPHGATQLPHATGIAWAMKMQAGGQAKDAGKDGKDGKDGKVGKVGKDGKDGKVGQTGGKVVLTFLDREATSAEDFHAGLNFAGVFRVPAVFVCINDAPAGAAPVQTVSETLAIKALAYGIVGIRVDGHDLFAVHAATRAAADRARKGEGATLIEAVVAETGDPLDRVRTWLASQNLLDAAAEATLRREVEAELAALP